MGVKIANLDFSEGRDDVLLHALDFIPSALLIAKAEGASVQALFVNKKFEEVLGYKREDVASLDAWFKTAYPDEKYRKEIRKKWNQEFQKALESGKNQVEVKARIFCHAQYYRWFNVLLQVKDGYQYLTFVDIHELEIKRQALAHSEEKFRLLAENVPAIFYLCDDDDQWTMHYINDKVEEILGYRKELFLSQHITMDKLVHPDDKDSIVNKLSSFRKKLAPFRLRYRILKANGQYIWVEENGTFIKKNDGRLQLEGIINDIEDQIVNELKESESNQRLKLATEGAGICIWEMNLLSGENFWDENLYALTGLPSKTKITNETMYSLIHKDDRKRTQEIVDRALQQGDRYFNTFRIITPAGQTKHLANAGVFKRNSTGEIHKLIGITYDITSQKSHEEAIIRLNKELEDINIQKNKLFSIIAHDLRGPIGRNRALLDILFTDWESMNKAEIHTHLEMIQSGTENINTLLEDLLLWSRTQFDSVKFSPDVVNVEEQLDFVIELMKPEADAKKIQLKKIFNSANYVVADANMFKTILRNLLANAIKFSFEGGTIDIETENGDNEVIIKVRDYGMGMKKDVLREVMNKNSKYTSFGTKGEKGSGLGLSICREFLAKHSKFMKILSKDGFGSTFMFSFNLAHIYK